MDGIVHECTTSNYYEHFLEGEGKCTLTVSVSTVRKRHSSHSSSYSIHPWSAHANLMRVAGYTTHSNRHDKYQCAHLAS